MDNVDSKSVVIKELIYIRKNIVVPKKHFNEFRGFYYRKVGDILTEASKFFKETFLLINDEIVTKNERFYIKSTVCITDGKARITANGWARETEGKSGMDESQLTGSASTYAEKRALEALFLLDNNNDPDIYNNNNPGPKNNKKTNNNNNNKPSTQDKAFKALDAGF